MDFLKRIVVDYLSKYYCSLYLRWIIKKRKNNCEASFPFYHWMNNNCKFGTFSQSIGNYYYKMIAHISLISPVSYIQVNKTSRYTVINLYLLILFQVSNHHYTVATFWHYIILSPLTNQSITRDIIISF